MTSIYQLSASELAKKIKSKESPLTVKNLKINCQNVDLDSSKEGF